MNEIDDTELARRLRADIDRMVGDVGNRLSPPAPAAAVSPDRPTSQHRWVAWSAAAATVALLVGGLIVIANRGADDDSVDADVPPVTSTPHPDTVPGSTAPASTVVPEPAQYETITSVIDDGGGAQMCFTVLESLPPQCGGGLELDQWSWDAIDVEQVQNGTTWVDSIYVRGTTDPAIGLFVVLEARIPTDEERERLTGGPALDFSVPCPEPDGGWPARNQEWPGEQIAAIDGYAGSWVDESQQVMTVKFTGDLAAAEEAVRQHYSDALCVVAGQHTEQELLAIQNQLMSISSVQFLGAGVYVDATGEWVQADVAVPDPQRQAGFDAEYGPGVVRLSSPLKPVRAESAPPASPPPATTPPVTAPSEPQMVEAVAIVLESSTHRPRLCVEGILDSYPPQCAGGPDLADWSWELIDDEESSGDTTWATSYVRGEFDSATNTLTVVEQRPPNDDDATRFVAAFPQPDLSTPCESPAGGWPARNQEWPGAQIATIEGYAGAWSQAGQPMTVKFTGDLAAAEAAIAQYYSDAVCIVPATTSHTRLLEIQDAVTAMFGQIGVMSVVVDATGEWVDVQTTAPMPDVQAGLDATFGQGVVRLRSLMIPAT